MSGEWIKMRTNLWDDPRVSRICDITGKPEATVIGGLYWLWATADEHSTDGALDGFSFAGIDRKVGIKGFAAAVGGVQWLEETPTGVTLRHFDEHNGASAKARAVTAKRVANHRKGNSDVTQAPLQEQHKSVNNRVPRSRSREEEPKGREEGVPTPEAGTASPPTHLADLWPKGLTPATWEQWRQHRVCKAKPMTPPEERTVLARLCEHPDPERTVLDALAKGIASLPPVGGWPSEQKRETRDDKHAATAAAIFHGRKPDDDAIDGTAERIA